MKRFVVPPNWPAPPQRGWVPPKTWQPDPAWPPAPEGWKFWVDGNGRPVSGPVGRYGGPGMRVITAGAGGLLLFLAVNLWALGALGLFDGDKEPRALPVVDSSPTPSATVAPPASRTTTKPSVQNTTKPTAAPTAKPTNTRTSRRPERSEESVPAPTKTAKDASPRLPTREQILVEYCRRQGLDPARCDPGNWPQYPARGQRNPR